MFAPLCGLPIFKATLPVLGFALPLCPLPAGSGDCTPGFREGEGMHSGSSVALVTGVSYIKDSEASFALVRVHADWYFLVLGSLGPLREGGDPAFLSACNTR